MVPVQTLVILGKAENKAWPLPVRNSGCRGSAQVWFGEMTVFSVLIFLVSNYWCRGQLSYY